MSDANANSTNMPHWPALDGLRGLAVAGVVAYHLGWLHGGFLGVDLFFVLSGFLITSLLVEEVDRTGRVALLAFWGRRFRRLLPAVTAMVALVLTAVARWGTAAERATAHDDAPWALGYLANWRQIAGAGDYWAAATSSSVFKHLWSLAIEEQFYVLWPVALWLLLRFGRRVAAVTTALAAAASAALLVLLADGRAPSRAYLGTDTRAVSLLLGALVALPAVREPSLRAVRSWRGRTPRGSAVAVDAGALLLATSWVVGGDHVAGLLRGGLVAHAAVAAFLVTVLTAGVADPLAHRPALVERLAASAPWVWLGRRSYGVYLWHWPLIVLAAARWTDLDGWAKDAGIVGATLVLAVVSYELLEQPIRRRGGWASGVHTARLATATCVAAAVLAAAIAPDGRGDVATFALPAASPEPARSVTGGEPARAAAAGAGDAGEAPGAPGDRTEPGPAAIVGTGRSATTSDAPSASGDADIAPPADVPVGEVAVASEAPTPPVADHPAVSTVLWIGDSVAADLAPAVLAALAAAGVPAVDGAFAGRRLVESDGVVPAELFPPLLADAGADLVVVQLSLWDSPFPVDVQRGAIEWFVDLVAPTGARLLFLAPPPIRRDLVDPGLDRQVAIVRELAAADPERVGYLDTAPLWGLTAAADLEGDGAPDRKPDLVHVCPQGAARFAGWLVDRLAERYAGVEPVFPTAWLDGGWSGDERYDTPAGACAALPVTAG